MIGVVVLVAGVLSPSAALAAPPARSNPIRMPVHTAFGLDCAGNNPGCTAHRTFFSIDVIPSGQFGRNDSPSHAKVYAMGGGTVHIGDAHGSRCGAPKGSFGTWVWIDHGNGVKSRYGHLSKILVKNGTRVAAGTPIGVVGATGKSSNCSVNYVDFEIFHGALKASDVHRLSTLQACTTGSFTRRATSATPNGVGRARRKRGLFGVDHERVSPAAARTSPGGRVALIASSPARSRVVTVRTCSSPEASHELVPSEFPA